ncbi:Flp pilus assembly complex ATPase component TadA [bacterium]|nr:Flp pilus assembly complex ATPase component TadA [bacterium]
MAGEGLEAPATTELLLRLVASLEQQLGYPATNRLAYSVSQLLGVAVKNRGNLLHLNAGSPPMVRIQDELVNIGSGSLTQEQCSHLVLSLLNPEQRRSLFQGREVNFTHQDAALGGFRVHAYLDRGCPAASLQQVLTEIPKLVELGLSGSAVERFLSEPSGLMLLTGRPRCGKINTFAALLSYINQNRKVRIVSVEPQIHIYHPPGQGTLIQREVGVDTQSFAQAIRQARNQDPDILAVGGIPDRETAEALIHEAASGRLVIALMDGANCANAVEQYARAIYNEDGRSLARLAHVVRLVVCQFLVNRADHRGKAPAFEVLEGTPEVQRAIATADTSALYHVMREEGMQTLGRHLTRLVEVGWITQEEALQHVDASELDLQPPQGDYGGSSDYYEPPSAPTLDETAPLMNWL